LGGLRGDGTDFWAPVTACPQLGGMEWGWHGCVHRHYFVSGL